MHIMLLATKHFSHHNVRMRAGWERYLAKPHFMCLAGAAHDRLRKSIRLGLPSLWQASVPSGWLGYRQECTDAGKALSMPKPGHLALGGRANGSSVQLRQLNVSAGSIRAETHILCSWKICTIYWLSRCIWKYLRDYNSLALCAARQHQALPGAMKTLALIPDQTNKHGTSVESLHAFCTEVCTFYNCGIKRK